MYCRPLGLNEAYLSVFGKLLSMGDPFALVQEDERSSGVPLMVDGISM